MRDCDLRFVNVPCKMSDYEVIHDFITDKSPKRINFASHHANSLRRVNGKNGVVGRLILPFDDTIDAIACKVMGMNKLLYPSKFWKNYYRNIFSEQEYHQIETFINQFNDLVFLRDTLDLSIALSMHETEPDKRTVLGEHEFRVKYRSENNEVSADFDALVAEMQRRLEELPYFNCADYICAVPSNKPFMAQIISRLKSFDFIDISQRVQWKNKAGSLKDATSAEEKLVTIQSWELRIDKGLDLNGKTVLLVDDLYHSGVTMQYMAMRLKESGAKRVFGMALVKSLGN